MRWKLRLPLKVLIGEFMDSLFCCPLCGKELVRAEGRYFCCEGHSFDIAREGYVNLLPVNMRHSREPGDDKNMVQARTRFLDGGWYGPLRDSLCRIAEKVCGSKPALLDVGCGEGYYTSALNATISERNGRLAGVDLSKAAVKRAAKRCDSAEIAVASAYHLPLADSSVDVLVDCFSPLDAGEFCRVLKCGGYFIYVVPGARHLWELKSVLYENPYENEEKVEEYRGFSFLRAEAVETGFTLSSKEDIQALFNMTPYVWKTPRQGIERLRELERLHVTAQFNIHIFRKEN